MSNTDQPKTGGALRCSRRASRSFFLRDVSPATHIYSKIR